jgi:hypothetical protein
MHIAVFGNCQATSVAAFLRTRRSDLRVLHALPNYLVEDEDQAYQFRQFAKCDVILCQRVSDHFPVSWARTSSIKAQFPDKVIVWPNVYFNGLYPDVRRLRSNGRLLRGPLGDYHFGSILGSFRNGVGLQDAIDSFSSGMILRKHPSPLESSFHELAKREAVCDVQISDFVRKGVRTENCFTTQDHPSAKILLELTKRLLQHCGVNDQVEGQEQDIRIASCIKIVPYQCITQKYALPYSTGELFVGIDRPEHDRPFYTETSRIFDRSALVHAFFSYYRSLQQGGRHRICLEY